MAPLDLPATVCVGFWEDFDACELDEGEDEAKQYDREVREELQWKLVTGPIVSGDDGRNVARAGSRPTPHAESSKAAIARTSSPALEEPAVHAEISFAPSEALPSFHPSHVVHTSTPRLLNTATFPIVSTPSDTSTPVLPRPTKSVIATSIRQRQLDTPEYVASPIDSPETLIVEGQSKRDDPSTPVPLGSGKFAKLKSRSDQQTLTKHFEAFSKNVAKATAAMEQARGKAKARGVKRAPSRAGSTFAGHGGRIFEGLRFCIPPDSAKLGVIKQWWDVLAKLGGQVTYQPDTAITHIINDSGRSASMLAHELGLNTLSELPEGTVCVKWQWVVQCKMAGMKLDPTPFLSFPKTTLTRSRVATSTDVPLTGLNLRQPPRFTDITAQLRGNSISISRKRRHTPSGSDTESPVRPMTKQLKAAPVSLQRMGTLLETHKSSIIGTVHTLPTRPGWEEAKDGERDGLDEEITGLVNGTGGDADVAELELDDDAEQNFPTDTTHGTRADQFRCGQDHDGTAGKAPNEWLAKKLEEMHDMYQGVEGKNFFAIRQYGQAASALRRAQHPITSREQALKLKGIGDGMADRIDEFLNDRPGRQFFEDTESTRVKSTFKDIYGVGKAFANELYRRGARSIDDLRTKDFGLTNGQLIGVELYPDLIQRIPRSECRQLYEIVRAEALSIDKHLWIDIMGSYRRGEDTSGDVDFLITRDPKDGITHAGVLPQLVDRLRRRGIITHDLSTPHDWKALEAKWMGVGKASANGLHRRIDILCIPFKQLGAALIYFTGNNIFNRSLRLYASKKGYNLNQRGLYKGVIRGKDRVKLTEGELVASKTEQEIFDVLGIRWRDPQQRRP